MKLMNITLPGQFVSAVQGREVTLHLDEGIKLSTIVGISANNRYEDCKISFVSNEVGKGLDPLRAGQIIEEMAAKLYGED
jgi:hypothetical protein